MIFLLIALIALCLLVIVGHYEHKIWWRKYDESPRNFAIKYKGRVIWHSRSCAIACFVFCKNKLGEWCVLANQRGVGCPDYQFYWNCICGYVDFNQTLEESCLRECKEETGIQLYPTDLKFYGINSDPKDSNKQNITIRYYVKLDDTLTESLPPYITNEGEKDEVNEVKWIPITKIDDYMWAFDHKKLIKEIVENKIVN